MDSLPVFLICLFATTLGAISGIGGGVIIKPVLDAVSGLPAASISFLSGCTVLSMSVVSLLRSRRGGVQLEKRRGTLLALSAAAGGLLGNRCFDLLRASWGDGQTIRAVQNAVMVALTAAVLAYECRKERIATRRLENGGACAAVGVLLGALSSFLGIGGGPVNLAALSFCFSMPPKTAALHSIYIIFFSQTANLLSAGLGGGIPDFEPAALAVMIAGGVAGGMIGQRLSRRMDDRQVSGLFRVMLVGIVLISCWNVWRSIAL